MENIDLKSTQLQILYILGLDLQIQFTKIGRGGTFSVFNVDLMTANNRGNQTSGQNCVHTPSVLPTDNSQGL
ncbi:unnamed protein product [Diabrotica balteata]|uniref:Uncharacterized protein n=1 Tax=Diabrotica balteata TaxID=107213 RepID=A0A9N9XD21_DIABA|nr:unnamed protein product [Diabrotica balteata]